MAASIVLFTVVIYKDGVYYMLLGLWFGPSFMCNYIDALSFDIYQLGTSPVVGMEMHR